MLKDHGVDCFHCDVMDGNCSLANIPLMKKSGADISVVGSSSVFDPKLGIAKGVKAVRACPEACLYKQRNAF